MSTSADVNNGVKLERQTSHARLKRQTSHARRQTRETEEGHSHQLLDMHTHHLQEYIVELYKQLNQIIHHTCALID